METENVKAIELKGIAHNTTKIGTIDGQSEDITNLRFKDGAWRTAGEGKQVYSMSSNIDGYTYTKLYIHTNVYRHLLGVCSDKLYWFADISTDGETITPRTRVEICDCGSDVYLCQTGHLLTVITGGKFSYFVFKNGTSEYVKMITDDEQSSSRELFPFGSVHFNLYSPIENPSSQGVEYKYAYKFPYEDTLNTYRRDLYVTAYGELKNNNKFSRPFLALAAIKMYDGSYMYASNPILLYPRSDSSRRYYNPTTESYSDCDYTLCNKRVLWDNLTLTNVGGVDRIVGNLITYQKQSPSGTYTIIGTSYNTYDSNQCVEPLWLPPVCEYRDENQSVSSNLKLGYLALGSDLVISIGDELYKVVANNKDLFSSICIFVTPEAGIFDVSKFDSTRIFYENEIARSYEDIEYDLLHSNYYLLKEYKIGEVSQLAESCIVDLTHSEDKNVLTNITTRDVLKNESVSRMTYIPEVQYMYNGRLHIANYAAWQFHGYPIDLFNLNNHSVKLQDNSYYKGVLKNLADNGDADMQWARTTYNFPNTSDTAPFAIIRTKIETDQGEQYVVRYIPEYDHTTAVSGRADFVEQLDPFICFPDYRAKQMEIYVRGVNVSGNVKYYYITLQLKAHPYLNLAYYMTSELKPLVFSGTDTINWQSKLVEQNNTESYPNAIKVAKMDNPMYFPNESTYQVGSAGVVGLMSNAVAIGTGQTGAAPLYVFCLDGVYALLVDASGEMAYTNSRIIARDVCNNRKSITPIDEGVVFTTDRGLMMIAGNEVQEIGEIMEGDWCKFTTEGNIIDYSKILCNAYYNQSQLAYLGQDTYTNVEFKDYITNAIINYDHNERELMVSNPTKSYTLIRDRNGDWSRRDFSADEYVSNYPSSYRLVYGVLFKVDKNTTNTNKFFLLSKEIKLDSIGFKELHRLVVRGYFNTVSGKYVGLYIFGSYDARKWACLGHREKTGTFSDLGAVIERTDCRYFRYCIAGQLQEDSRIDYVEVSSRQSKLSTKIR